jgi:hypothetical protein
MKKLLFIIGVAFFSTLVNAQDSSAVGANAYTSETKKTANTENPTLGKSFIWSIGVEPSAAVGHFHNLAKFGFGASLQGEIRTSKSIGLTINAGYIAYGGKTADSIKYPSFKYWPVMGGLKVYMGKAYLHGQAGAGFGSSGLGTSFWYGAGLGMNFTKRIDAELRYAGWKQEQVNESNVANSGVYGGGTGGSGGGYGGHYSTVGVRVAVNF